MLRSHHHLRGFIKLVLLWKPEDGRYRPKHVVLFCYKYHHFSHIIVVFLTEIYPLPYSLNTQRGWHTSELLTLVWFLVEGPRVDLQQGWITDLWQTSDEVRQDASVSHYSMVLFRQSRHLFYPSVYELPDFLYNKYSFCPTKTITILHPKKK